MKKLLIFLVTVGAIMGISHPAQAMKQRDLAGQVYLVTYLNANALRTSYQYMFFTSNGRAAIVPVADVDANGRPVVTTDATARQRKAPATIKHLLNNPHYLNRQATKRPVRFIGKQQVMITANGMRAKPTGKLTANSTATDFTVDYATKQQKYTSVHFKRAPTAFQYQ